MAHSLMGVSSMKSVQCWEQCNVAPESRWYRQLSPAVAKEGSVGLVLDSFHVTVHLSYLSGLDVSVCATIK